MYKHIRTCRISQHDFANAMDYNPDWERWGHEYFSSRNQKALIGNLSTEQRREILLKYPPFAAQLAPLSSAEQDYLIDNLPKNLSLYVNLYYQNNMPVVDLLTSIASLLDKKARLKMIHKWPYSIYVMSNLSDNEIFTAIASDPSSVKALYTSVPDDIVDVEELKLNYKWLALAWMLSSDRQQEHLVVTVGEYLWEAYSQWSKYWIHILNTKQ